MATIWPLAVLAWMTALLFVLPGASAGTTDADAEPQIGPVPAWVTPTQALATRGQTLSASGVEYLLLDQQIRVSNGPQSTYFHIAVRASADNGLEQAAQVAIEFDPAYQRLTLHNVSVHRAGRTIEKLQRETWKVFNRERDLERQILDGRRSVHFVLDDVRVGDVVDYAYTVEGTNPVFGSARFGRFDQKWTVPVARLRQRLLWPTGHPMRLLPRNGADTGEPANVKGYEGRRWVRDNLAPLARESDAPGWYDPYPAIYWGDFDNWAAVVAWALPLYQTPAPLGPDLSLAVQGIANRYPSPAERVAAVLRLVQGEVRYLGVEVGVNSHAPNQPDVVYERRYGDCKDKALLMVAMLRQLGIEASPALVNPYLRRGVADGLPSPGVFNHVIVKVTVGHRARWLDPTRALQPGLLDTLYEPNYERALVVQAGSHDLEDMGAAAARTNKHRMSILLDASAGPGHPAELVVSSVLYGFAADMMRADLAAHSQAEVEKSYLNYYVGFYPGATNVGDVAISDDTRTNQLTVVKRYLLPEVWRKADKAPRPQLSVYSGELRDFLHQTTEPVRTAPLVLEYPLDVQLVTEVKLPLDWPAAPLENKVKNEFFEYDAKVTWPEPRRMVQTESLRILKDHVPADKVAEHAQLVDKALKSMGLVLTLPDATVQASAGGANWLLMFIAGGLLAALLWLAMRLYHYDPAPLAMRAGTAEETSLPGGIRSWLLLVAIGIVFTPLLALREVWQLRPYFDLTTWNYLAAPGSAHFHPWWAPVILFEMFMYLSLLVLGVLLVVLFFRKRSSLPRLWIAIGLASVVATFIDAAMIRHLPSELFPADALNKVEAGFVRTLIATGIWTAYFLRSKRVRATFVRRRSPARPSPTSAPMLIS